MKAASPPPWNQLFRLCLVLVLICACGARHTFKAIPQPSNNPLPGQGWIDLLPLMQLRIENAYYQKGSSRRGLDGFLGTEVARYQFTDGALHLLSVQPMKERPPGDMPVQQLIAPSLLHARFYRLYFEIVFNRASNTRGSVLLASDSLSDLDQPQKLCEAGSPHCAVFPEACSVSVEMDVLVNGTTQTLVWGSLLESVVGQHPHHLELKRLDSGRPKPVHIKASDPEALRLPLLPGDQIIYR